jgi:hypothetical protein
MEIPLLRKSSLKAVFVEFVAQVYAAHATPVNPAFRRS